MKHILAHVSKLLGVDVQFANDCVGEDAGVKAAAFNREKHYCSRIFVSMQKKKANLVVWPKDASDEEKAAAKGYKRKSKRVH